MRVLVIDDDVDMRAMLEQTLRSAGHEVASAADGREGVNLRRTSPADLVVTDLFMPNQEGLETITKLRKEFPTTDIIAMSGKTGANIVLSIAKRLGAVAVLEKPFFPEQLLCEVDKVCARNHEPSEQTRSLHSFAGTAGRNAMRVLMRQQQSGLYYVEADRWSAEKAKAHDFQSGDRAVDVAVKAHLIGAEMVYDFGDPTLAIAVPINSRT